MGLIYRLANIIEDSRKEYEEFLISGEKVLRKSFEFECREAYGKEEREKSGVLALGDNLEFMKYLIFDRKIRGDVKLIYVDPPFFSKADYDRQVKIHAKCFEKTSSIKQTLYSDTWKEGMESYLRMICVRLFVMRELLAEDGCLWMHLDWHAAHYVKILMDEIFGEENFVNEVIWNYKSGGTGKKRFARKHDTLLYYGKSKNYFFEPLKEKSYNRGLKPYRFKGVEEFEDELGWYTLVNMKDVWQIDMVGRTSSERTGYATQKPEALLERILTCCSKEGDLCVDFFGGSGTLAVTAHKMGRRWISSDIGIGAVSGIKKRLLKIQAEFEVMYKEDESRGSEGSFKIFCKKNQENVYIIELQGYNTDEDTKKGLQPKEREILSEISEKDSLSLIDYWSVDFDYDGAVHRPQIIKIREKDRLEEKIEGTCREGLISISCVDVFGNVSQKLLKFDAL